MRKSQMSLAKGEFSHICGDAFKVKCQGYLVIVQIH